MAVDKIDTNITTHQILNERLKEATSGKKNNVHSISTLEAKDANSSSTESVVFSEDAKKLQETEVILRNALQKLHEMDDVNHEAFANITNNSQSFKDIEENGLSLSDLIFPEEEMRMNIQKRMKADEFVEKINEFDTQKLEIDHDKLNNIKDKISSGFYSQPEVINQIADQIISVIQ